jgi:cell wall-associated NlpC family hydrolase
MTRSTWRARALVRAAAVAAVAVLASACATTRVVRPPPPPPPAGDATVLPRPGVVATALGLQGVPYRLGGDDPSGFDCSGLVQYVFAQNGRRVARVVAEQYGEGRPVTRREVQPGDLVFFATSGRRVSHVGIAIGGGQFVHAPSSRGVVRVESLDAAYWSRHYAGARRVD